MLADLVRTCRSIRRYKQDATISLETLRELVDLARLSPCSANMQPLKYMLFNDPEANARIFPNLAWAGYLKDWNGPEEGERPAAYIVMLGDTSIRAECAIDSGIAAQSIVLGAAEKGIGACMMTALTRAPLRRVLDVPEQYDIIMVVALGEPAETVVLEPMGDDGDVKYYRDEQGVHHVPKRSLDEIIIT